ncbi:MAG: SDR family oxidoreductase [Acidimicrobiaceae bacterium]|nr:SDR family oxidoreductase [Acidimicrobiaceae bacterium]
MGFCDGRVVIVTGAGRGLGRAHALAYAAEGAHVLVNDLGVHSDGTQPGADDAATAVVEEIVAGGGSAAANHSDVADWDQAGSMVAQAIDTWGRLDTLVCNAGFLRDRMLVNMSEQEWDAVVRVHLKGHFVPARHAVGHWRERQKTSGDPPAARIVNTSSGAGLMGSIGQGNYAAAKAAIALLTVQQAAEWGRYGVLANAIAPDARTRMTAVIPGYPDRPDEGWDTKAPENVSPLVVWLGSEDCDVTGRVFECTGGQLNVCDGWQHGPVMSIGDRAMTVAEASGLARRSVEAEQPPAPVFGTR